MFTITNRRVVMRYGVALPWSLNLPYRTIESAAVNVQKDGTADIAVVSPGLGRISYLHLWPFARPWRINSAQPMMRALPDGLEVARILAGALKTFAKPRPTERLQCRSPFAVPVDAVNTPAAAAAA